MRWKTLCIISVLVVAGILFVQEGIGLCEAGMTVRIEPSTLLLGTFYRGTDIKITGTVPDGCDVVVRFMGIEKELHLKKKGKVLGLLWMNLDTFKFKGVPNVCLIYSSTRLASDTSKAKEARDEAWKLSLEALENRIGIEPEPKDRSFLIKELIKMKKLEGLYLESEGSVTVVSGDGEQRTFEAHVNVPSSLTPGKYVIEVYALRDGRIVETKTTPVEAKLVGFPAFLYNLAFNHALLYGLLATMVAIAGGLLMGVIFGAGKGAH